MSYQPRKTKYKLKVKRSSAGLGLFAMEEIKKGDFIIEYYGPILSDDEADEKGGNYIFEINSKWCIDGSPRYNTARYINHSCRPNAEPDTRGKKVFIYARRRIKAGEEITYDYGEEYFKEMTKDGPCRCLKCSGN